jgi:hypothetical protein
MRPGKMTALAALAVAIAAGRPDIKRYPEIHHDARWKRYVRSLAPYRPPLAVRPRRGTRRTPNRPGRELMFFT